MLSFTLEGIEELEREAEREIDRTLVPHLVTAVKVASDAGAAEARARHPYMDRTGDLTRSTEGDEPVVRGRSVEGGISADEDYASYVDRGTSRAKAYPFMIFAESEAKKVLPVEAEKAAEAFAEKMNRE